MVCNRYEAVCDQLQLYDCHEDDIGVSEKGEGRVGCKVGKMFKSVSGFILAIDSPLTL